MTTPSKPPFKKTGGGLSPYSVLSTEKFTEVVHCSPFVVGQQEAEANRDLCLEALEVFAETGLTPRQLQNMAEKAGSMSTLSDQDIVNCLAERAVAIHIFYQDILARHPDPHARENSFEHAKLEGQKVINDIAEQAMRLARKQAYRIKNGDADARVATI